MKLLRDRFSKKIYLLPLLLAVSLFLYSQGVILPNLVNAQEARLSKPKEIKPLSCIITKAQIKSSQFRLVKVAPYFDLFRKVEVSNHQPSQLAVFNHESHAVTISLDLTVPARAPPA